MRIIVTVAVVLLLTGCGSGDKPTTAPPPAAASPTYDGSTLAACRDADKVTDVPMKDTYRQADMARRGASLSDVPALRELARRYSDAPAGTTLDEVRAQTAAAEIATWCIEHHVKG